jgi:hypothetical protein
VPAAAVIPAIAYIKVVVVKNWISEDESWKIIWLCVDTGSSR